LVEDCTYPGADQPLELLVRGFANDLPILDGQRAGRKDSNQLNLALANLRGEALYSALRDVSEKEFPQLSKELLIRLQRWQSWDEMRFARDNEVFRNLQIAVSPEIDHRSAVLVVEKPGKCPSLVSPSATPVQTDVVAAR
jgi:hypothetical protein